MIAGLVLVALVLLAGTLDRTGSAGAVALAAISILWLVVNDPMEGDTIFTVTRGHGLTVADLTGLAGVALAAWHLARRAR